MEQSVHLHVESVSKSFDDTVVLDGVSLTVERGKTLALLGPSGSGKTTLLRIIAGLETPDRGRVSIGGEVLTDGSRVVAPERRNVGLVFQDGALFPHMTVGANVGYGLSPEKRRQRVTAALEMVDLAGFEHRQPHTLSGGQARRVAIARALAPEPRVLLLDEPFSNLDTELRVRVRTDVARLLSDLQITAVYVTHDQEEAFVVGDEVAVLNDSRIVQTGTPSHIYQHPATAWVARFVGDANVLPAELRDGRAETIVGDFPTESAYDGPAHVLVRPEQLSLQPHGDGVIRHIEFYGHDTSYTVSVGDVELLVRSIAAPKFRVGDAVGLGFLGGAVTVYPSIEGVRVP